MFYAGDDGTKLESTFCGLRHRERDRREEIRRRERGRRGEVSDFFGYFIYDKARVLRIFSLLINVIFVTFPF